MKWRTGKKKKKEKSKHKACSHAGFEHLRVDVVGVTTLPASFSARNRSLNPGRLFPGDSLTKIMGEDLFSSGAGNSIAREKAGPPSVGPAIHALGFSSSANGGYINFFPTSEHWRTCKPILIGFHPNAGMSEWELYCLSEVLLGVWFLHNFLKDSWFFLAVPVAEFILNQYIHSPIRGSPKTEGAPEQVQGKWEIRKLDSLLMAAMIELGGNNWLR